MTAKATISDSGSERIKNLHPLYLIVGDRQVSPCDHETFGRFKLWVANKLTSGNIDIYATSEVSIEHWDDQASDVFPYLLNPCECGTYLPIEIDPCPMFSSAIGLLTDLSRLNQHRDDMEPAFHPLVDSMLAMANLSLEQNIALEIR